MTRVGEAQASLGARLRELRRDAHLEGRQLATLAGWQPSKVSKIEHGKQTPTEADIHAWCIHTGATLQIHDLIASVRNIQAAYLEWKRICATGAERRQKQSIALEQQTELIRGYDPDVVPGQLQTADYAAGVLRAGKDLYELPDDIDAAVTARIERQRVLREGIHRVHLIVHEQVLYTTVADNDVTARQLEQLLEHMTLLRVVFGVIPRDFFDYRVPATNFQILDRRLVLVEAVTAELSITQPREIVLYEKVFAELAKQARYGVHARTLIMSALDKRRGPARNHSASER